MITETSSRRNNTIDILRTLAILAVVFAHSNSQVNTFLFNLRTFDVVMLVFLSGSSFYYAKKEIDSTNRYIFKRFVRLIVSSWFISLLYISLIAVKGIILNSTYSFDYTLFVKSLLFKNGIPYIWILYYLFVVSIINRLFYKTIQSLSQLLVIFLLLLIYIVFSFINIGLDASDTFHNALSFYFITPVIYSMISLFGYKFITFSLRLKIACVLFLLTSTIIFITVYGFIPDSFKYPPEFFYVSYGLLVTLGLYTIINNQLARFPGIILFSFISKNSIWIYLTHIIIVQVYFSILYNPIDDDFLMVLIHFTINTILPVLLVYLYFELKNRKKRRGEQI